MLDYDDEASRYDATRGGEERGAAAAAAIVGLTGPATGVCVDVAGGTGVVSQHLTNAGWRVVVLDRSVGMLGVAATRLPGRVVAGDAARLPLPDRSVDLVTTVWLLHLVPDLADTIAGEAARVLRPGGYWVTSVDKDVSHRRPARSDADDTGRVTDLADRLGLDAVGTASFTGTTVWRAAEDPPDQEFRLAAFRRRADRTPPPAGA